MEGAYTPPLLLLPVHEEAKPPKRRRRATKAELVFAPLPESAAVPVAPPSAVRQRGPVRLTAEQRARRVDDIYALMVDAWAAGYDWSQPEDDEGVGAIVLRKGRRAGVVVWPCAVARLTDRGWSRKLGEIRRLLGLEVAS